MKMPSVDSVRKSFRFYAYKAGFTVHPHSEGSVPVGVPGTYSLFDIRTNYYTHKNLPMDRLVHVILGELYMVEYNKQNGSK